MEDMKVDENLDDEGWGAEGDDEDEDPMFNDESECISCL